MTAPCGRDDGCERCPTLLLAGVGGVGVIGIVDGVVDIGVVGVAVDGVAVDVAVDEARVHEASVEVPITRGTDR